MAIGPPLVNGSYFDFSSIQIFVATGVKITGFKSINYTSEQSPGEVYGAARQQLGRTPGQHKASGSFEIYRPEFLDLQQALQGSAAINSSDQAVGGPVPGLFEVSFQILCAFSEAGPLGVATPANMPIQSDVIIGARIVKVDQSHSQGSDALTVKCDFHAMMIYYNNATPLNLLLKSAGLS